MVSILIVEDDLVSSLYLEKILHNLGYTSTYTAKSGPEGVEKAREVKPNVIFMDISMPGEYDGIEATRIIEAELSIPVIFSTAFDISSYMDRIKEISPFGYIMKPYKEVEIKAAIYVALYRNNMENKLQGVINKYKESLYFQILISNFLVELNNSYDLYDSIDDLLLFIRESLCVDLVSIYQLDEHAKLKYLFDSRYADYDNIKLPEILDLNNLLDTGKVDVSLLEKRVCMAKFNFFSKDFKKYIKDSGAKVIITYPLFIDLKLFGLMVVSSFSSKTITKNVRDNLVTVSKAFSLVFKRHFDFLKIQEAEKEKLIQEQINIRKERLATIGQLSGAITHEISQPLQSIKLLSDSVLLLFNDGKKIPYEKALENFDKISNHVDRIDRIIANLKLLIKSPDKIDIMPYDINNIITQIKDLIIEKLEPNGIGLVLNLESNLNKGMVCDIQFQQVIVNIVDNAINAFHVVCRKDKKITIETKQNNDFVIVKFIDNGPGIDEESKKKLFDPFFSACEKKEGMGLGLYIVYNILKTFGAKIDVYNNADSGLTFEIWLNKSS